MRKVAKKTKPDDWYFYIAANETNHSQKLLKKIVSATDAATSP